MLAKKSSKKEVLDSFATVLAQERAKLKKQEQKKRRVIEEDSDSDSDVSINVIENPTKEEKWEQVTKTLKGKKLKKRKVTLDEPMPEEQAFLEQTLQAEDESSISSKESN